MERGLGQSSPLDKPREQQVKEHYIAPGIVEAELREAGFEIVRSRRRLHQVYRTNGGWWILDDSGAAAGWWRCSLTVVSPFYDVPPRRQIDRRRRERTKLSSPQSGFPEGDRQFLSVVEI